MPRVNNIYISYCGLVCQFCKAYVNKRCEGCDVHIEACKYANCAGRKNLRCCLECKDFPCKLHREGFVWETEEFGKLNWKVFSEVFLRVFSQALEE